MLFYTFSSQRTRCFRENIWMDRWTSAWSRLIWRLVVIVSVFSKLSDSTDFLTSDGALELNNANFEQTISTAEFTFVNFYANWCRFSQILEPIFNDVANNVKKEFTSPGQVLLAKVDCDGESSIAAKYHISKYPTLKMFRHGEVQKKEYRGQRSVESLTNFVKEQLKDAIKEFQDLDDIKQDDKKRKIIGYFDTKQSAEYLSYKKLASTLRSECEFHAGFGEASETERPSGNAVVYRSIGGNSDAIYPGDLNDYKLLFQWAQDKCIPLVREITFENAEELTEEGLPFLILFHKPDDTQSVEEYSKVISSELLPEKHAINFLTADGLKFAHPLHHLGKSQNDLPLIAIDSFRHMYLFPLFNDIKVPGKLKQFIASLHSGKLHREFHQGPDPTSTPAPSRGGDDDDGDDGGDNDDDDRHRQQQQGGGQDHQQGKTAPPESTFRKLGPSRNRYTLLKDEL